MHWRPGESTGERVYKSIKARVIAYEFPEGERIYLDPLAAALGVSTTPVREAMNRLAAKGLVIKAPRKGFFAMTLSEENLKGHYDLLTHEIEKLENVSTQPLWDPEPIAEILIKLQSPRVASAHTLAQCTGDLFSTLSFMSNSARVIRLIENANDHLYYIRTVECYCLPGVMRELVRLCELLLGGRCGELIAAIGNYHKRRLPLVAKLVEIARA